MNQAVANSTSSAVARLQLPDQPAIDLPVVVGTENEHAIGIHTAHSSKLDTCVACTEV